MEQRAHWEVWHQSKLHDFNDVLAQYTYRCATAVYLHMPRMTAGLLRAQQHVPVPFCIQCHSWL